MKFTDDEKKYVLNILEQQQKDIKKFEKIPDDYFQAFGDEVKLDEFLTVLVDKIKKN